MWQYIFGIGNRAEGKSKKDFSGIMKYTFISGIPASGKSHLASKIAKEIGIQHFTIDDWWKEMKDDPKLKKWVDFFWNKAKEKYGSTTNCEKQWENILPLLDSRKNLPIFSILDHL